MEVFCKKIYLDIILTQHIRRAYHDAVDPEISAKVVVVQFNFAKTHLMSAETAGPGDEFGEDPRRIGIQVLVDEKRQTQYQKSKQDSKKQKNIKDFFHKIGNTRLSYQKMDISIWFGGFFNFRQEV
jgi:hypothetical protein